MAEPSPENQFHPSTSEGEITPGQPPLGFKNPILPPHPLGQNFLSPKFLSPLGAKPLGGSTSLVGFSQALPDANLPDNFFQDSPFFVESRLSLINPEVANPNIPNSNNIEESVVQRQPDAAITDISSTTPTLGTQTLPAETSPTAAVETTEEESTFPNIPNSNNIEESVVQRQPDAAITDISSTTPTLGTQTLPAETSPTAAVETTEEARTFPNIPNSNNIEESVVQRQPDAAITDISSAIPTLGTQTLPTESSPTAAVETTEEARTFPNIPNSNNIEESVVQRQPDAAITDISSAIPTLGTQTLPAETSPTAAVEANQEQSIFPNIPNSNNIEESVVQRQPDAVTTDISSTTPTLGTETLPAETSPTAAVETTEEARTFPNIPNSNNIEESVVQRQPDAVTTDISSTTPTFGTQTLPAESSPTAAVETTEEARTFPNIPNSNNIEESVVQRQPDAVTTDISSTTPTLGTETLLEKTSPTAAVEANQEQSIFPNIPNSNNIEESVVQRQPDAVTTDISSTTPTLGTETLPAETSPTAAVETTEEARTFPNIPNSNNIEESVVQRQPDAVTTDISSATPTLGTQTLPAESSPTAAVEANQEQSIFPNIPNSNNIEESVVQHQPDAVTTDISSTTPTLGTQTLPAESSPTAAVETTEEARTFPNIPNSNNIEESVVQRQPDAVTTDISSATPTLGTQTLPAETSPTAAVETTEEARTFPNIPNSNNIEESVVQRQPDVAITDISSAIPTLGTETLPAETSPTAAVEANQEQSIFPNIPNSNNIEESVVQHQPDAVTTDISSAIPTLGTETLPTESSPTAAVEANQEQSIFPNIPNSNNIEESVVQRQPDAAITDISSTTPTLGTQTLPAESSPTAAVEANQEQSIFPNIPNSNNIEESVVQRQPDAVTTDISSAIPTLGTETLPTESSPTAAVEANQEQSIFPNIPNSNNIEESVVQRQPDAVTTDISSAIPTLGTETLPTESSPTAAVEANQEQSIFPNIPNSNNIEESVVQRQPDAVTTDISSAIPTLGTETLPTESSPTAAVEANQEQSIFPNIPNSNNIEESVVQRQPDAVTTDISSAIPTLGTETLPTESSPTAAVETTEEARTFPNIPNSNNIEESVVQRQPDALTEDNPLEQNLEIPQLPTVLENLVGTRHALPLIQPLNQQSQFLDTLSTVESSKKRPAIVQRSREIVPSHSHDETFSQTSDSILQVPPVSLNNEPLTIRRFATDEIHGNTPTPNPGIRQLDGFTHSSNVPTSWSNIAELLGEYTVDSPSAQPSSGTSIQRALADDLSGYIPLDLRESNSGDSLMNFDENPGYSNLSSSLNSDTSLQIPFTQQTTSHEQASSVEHTEKPEDDHNEDSQSLEMLAWEIYGLIRQRLEIERERFGNYYSGRLPW